jgi:hypothetical protein
MKTLSKAVDRDRGWVHNMMLASFGVGLRDFLEGDIMDRKRGEK